MNRTCFALLSIILTIMLSTRVVKAQVDPHFSQYYIYPHFMNPATAGVMNGTFRVSGIYRNQWSNVTNPYSTGAMSIDAVTEKNINIGGSILNQSAGDAGYKYTTGYLSLAYTGVKLGADQNHQITVGLQGGFINRRFDPSKFRADDQWIPGIGFNPGLPSTDIFPVKTQTVLDLGAGIFYHNGNTESKASFYGGAAVFHLNKPKDPFVSANDLPFIPLRLTVHGGVIVWLSDYASVVPNFLYLKQGTATEKMAGTYLKLFVNETTDFMIGGNYRFGDSFSGFAGVTFNQFTVGASYDVTTSQLARFSRGANSFELSFSYLIKKERTNRVIYFDCPRF